MSHNVKDTNVNPAASSSGAVETTQIESANAASGSWVADMKIDRGS